MSRHQNSEAYQMDHLRSSPSQQHLDPSRSSSLSQPDEEMEQNDSRLPPNERPHKLDLYSIPVFLLEVIVLLGLAYSAYFIHFEYKHVPMISGFYCDDVTLRQPFVESKFIQQFTRLDNEIFTIVSLLAVPVVAIVFCELVNSMFGSLKFRQIRAICACCKLHSITRRTFRFAGAYALGFLIIMISCDILANTTGHFRPYLAQECPTIYSNCDFTNSARNLDSSIPSAQAQTSSEQPGSSSFMPATSARPAPSTSADANLMDSSLAPEFGLARPPSSPIISEPTAATNATSIHSLHSVQSNGSLLSPDHPAGTDTAVDSSQSAALERSKRQIGNQQHLVERRWINLVSTNLTDLCRFEGDAVQTRKFDQLAMSWPSFPAAVFTYACLFIACYLSFVGTARPFRIITCVLVMILLLLATIFNTWLVKVHYQHWEDVAASTVLALVVIVFIVAVYLNYFRDTHFYEKQKLFSGKRRLMGGQESFRGYNNEVATGQYTLDKTDGPPLARGDNIQNGDTGAISNNDLAMRYFQIPRANYRGAPRPLSSLNQMRS